MSMGKLLIRCFLTVLKAKKAKIFCFFFAIVTDYPEFKNVLGLFE